MIAVAEKTKIKLDIACGQSKQEGFRGIDISTDSDADDIWDLSQFPWPYEDDSVEEAFASHYVEHTYPVGGPNDGLVAFMNEVHRILEPNAKIRIVYPHLQSNRAFQDPFHTRYIPIETWHYFTKEWLEANKLDHYPIDCDFQIETCFFSSMLGDWGQRSTAAQQQASAWYWNVLGDAVVDLRKK